MKLNLDEIKRMNTVQLQIFKYFSDVCNELNLKYYMIHGSLLGAVVRKGFFPYDDDIDVAMFRDDYEKLIREGQKYLPDNLFIQSCISERDYPLSFAKIRDSNTAFIQPVLRNLDVNKGMYIDIFPIDNYPLSGFRNKMFDTYERILNMRIGCRLFTVNKQSSFRRLLESISVLLCPSWHASVKRKAYLYSSVKKNDRVIIVGGKKVDRGIPTTWFGDGIWVSFEDINVCCPSGYDEYLTHIYGDYKNYEPMGKYMNADGTVTVSAEIISTDRSYISF